MAKNKDLTDGSGSDTVDLTASPDAFELSLDEFCTRLSAKERTVELIGGFHATELAAGRIKDSADAFDSRFRSFVNQPA